MRRCVVVPAAALLLAACTTADFLSPGGDDLVAPSDLTYQLVPSGDPTRPVGVLLRWDPPNDSRIASYVVYSRSSSGSGWSRRAETTSASFSDLGIPDYQYYVASRGDDGTESAGSEIVTVSLDSPLASPAALASVSLDGAVQLAWSDDSRRAAPGRFDFYRVYSSTYDLDRNLCGDWVLEGTTVSEDFIASGLPNGQPRCFAVSVVATDGQESDWTTPRADTPRYDARNIVLYAAQVDRAHSGFSFAGTSPGDYGLVRDGSRSDIDFRIDRGSDGALWLTPVRSGTQLALYANHPIADLTSIDLAPVGGFSTGAIEAVAGYGYVFETRLADGLHFGGVRVTAVGSGYVILDWSYQTDPGNPELLRVRG